MSEDFIFWANKLATNDYLLLFYENYQRIKLYGFSKSKTDLELHFILNNIPADVSAIPFESRNSQQYLEICPNASILVGDWSICEKVAEEFIQCAKECASTQYYMTFCQIKNASQPDDYENFKKIQKRAYNAGVSHIPFETLRARNFSDKIAFFLAPISKYC